MAGEAVALLVPVLRRPHRVEPLLASITAATPEPHRVLFIADPDDVEELDALRDAGADVLIKRNEPRSYAAKINAGFDYTTEPFVFSAADDLDFHPGWFTRALDYFTDGVEVVGTNDLCNPRTMRGEHSTHTLFRRSYIDTCSGVVDEPGRVLHEGYAHQYCDDEFVQTAIARNVFVHARDVYVEHLHPWVKKADDDSTYQRGRDPIQTARARRRFKQRSRLWSRLQS